jgi:hypothetical protein
VKAYVQIPDSQLFLRNSEFRPTGKVTGAMRIVNVASTLVGTFRESRAHTGACKAPVPPILIGHPRRDAVRARRKFYPSKD